MATFWQITPNFTVRQGSIAVSQFHDGPISIDVAELLADAETIESPVCVLRLIPEIGSDADETAYPTGLDGSASFDGTVITQGITSLVFGRVYRLVLTFGAANNRRSCEVFLQCVA